MHPVKIVIIGAGSASFGLNTLAKLIGSTKLNDSHLALVDCNAHALALVSQLAEQLNREWGTGMHVSSHLHHQEALENADFVVLAIEVPPREKLWKSDFEIPLKFGVRQPYAENGGPGGFIHAARNIGAVLGIARAMEQQCPTAWLINFTNPMVRICDAIHRFSKIKVVGLCHQILVGYSLVGITLAKELHFEIPAGITGSHATPDEIPLRRYVARQAIERLDIQAAGLNHFTWMLSLHDRKTGDDLYPLFLKRWSEMPPSFEPLTRRIFEIFGLFPIPGDEHMCEYLPWVSDLQTCPWEKYDLSLYEWERWAEMRQQGYERLQLMASGDEALNDLRKADSEGALEIIENIAGSGDHYHQAVNLPNQGQILNLPPDAIVETPGFISGAGVQAVNTGELPGSIAELCRRELAVVRLGVDASVNGDRQTALQCLLLDPVITDIETARQILDEYLLAYRETLPQFWR